MIETNEGNKSIIKAIVAIIMVVWAFGTIRYGYYVDENGLLSIYKGIYQGQRMFVDSWESLQTGGLLAYPLLALYYELLKPIFTSMSINIGLVLYMRYCYMFVRMLVAIYVYRTLKNSQYENGAYPAALFYFMFVIGWKDFSYKSYCDIAMMLIICFLFRYYEDRKPIYAALMGVAVCVAVLAYPTMIIMAVFLGAYWLFMVIKDEAPRSAVIGYVSVCLVIGLIVVLYLQFTSGWGNIIAQISNLGDQDYDDPAYIRLGKMLASYLAFAVISYLPIVGIRLWDKMRGLDEYAERTLLTLYFALFMAAVLFLRVESISTSRFIYGCLIIFFWFPYFISDREVSLYTRIGQYRNTGSEGKIILWTIFIFSCVAQLIWAVSTNQEITVPGHMTLYVVMAMILLFCEDEFDYRGLKNILMFLAIFFMGIWVADQALEKGQHDRRDHQS